MPVEWDVTAILTCDAADCNARLSVAGYSKNECVGWIRQSRWTYRWSTLTGERRLIVRCPLHPESYDEELDND